MGRQQGDTRAGDSTKEALKQRIETLPEEHVEQLLHQARALEALPPSPPPQAEVGAAPTAQGELDWKCLRCDQMFPRPLEEPDHCPSCGAPRDELVLLERAA